MSSSIVRDATPEQISRPYLLWYDGSMRPDPVTQVLRYLYTDPSYLIDVVWLRIRPWIVVLINSVLDKWPWPPPVVINIGTDSEIIGGQATIDIGDGGQGWIGHAVGSTSSKLWIGVQIPQRLDFSDLKLEGNITVSFSGNLPGTVTLQVIGSLDGGGNWSNLGASFTMGAGVHAVTAQLGRQTLVRPLALALEISAAQGVDPPSGIWTWGLT